jgi:hypothetical protein
VYATVNRRHDRTPATGWGWQGQIALNPFDVSLDYGGYNNEQILSTSHSGYTVQSAEMRPICRRSNSRLG